MNEEITRPDEIAAFDVYFASICSMRFHPGAGQRGHVALDVGECFKEAMKMIEQRRKVVKLEGR